jgi:redox-sensing transcriptional repressor
MKTVDHISEFTIYRLSIYKRCLEHLEREQIKTISSKDFAARFGLNSAQVRKDLAYFGEFGIRGMGYPVTTLKEQIMHILGISENTPASKIWKILIVGAGKIGTALLKYEHFRHHTFEIVAAIDTDPTGSEYLRQQQAGLVNAPIVVYPLAKLEQVIAEHAPDIAVLAVSEDDAQPVADRLVTAGIHAILNFVPVQLLVPANVKVRTVDLIAELQSLTYHLHKQATQQSEDPSAEEAPSSP